MDMKGAYAALVQRVAVGFHGDRMTTVGASEIGACARQVGYRKGSVPEDEGYVDTGGFALRGNIMEDNALVPLIRAAVEAAGGDLLWASQNEQQRIVHEQEFASATPDGLAVNLPHDFLASHGVPDITNGSGEADELCVLVELKSIDPRVSEANLPKPEHCDQVNFSLGLVRETAFEIERVTTRRVKGKEVRRSKMVTTSYRPNYAVLVYMDASDYSNVRTYVIAYDEPGAESQGQRARHIMSTIGWTWSAKHGSAMWKADDGKLHKAPNPDVAARRAELLRPEGKIGMSAGKACKYCEFSQRCRGYAAMVPQQVADAAPPKVIKRVRKLAASFLRIKEQIAALAGQQKDVESQIKEELAAARLRGVVSDDVKVSWSSIAGRVTYSTDKMRARLKELGEDVEKFASTGKGSDRLNVEFVSALASV